MHAAIDKRGPGFDAGGFSGVSAPGKSRGGRAFRCKSSPRHALGLRAFRFNPSRGIVLNQKPEITKGYKEATSHIAVIRQ
jgi:hypothetical protein